MSDAQAGIWTGDWRDRIWSRLEGGLDLIIIGGGITGAGIFRRSAQSGLRVLLVEAQDFAAGTSSRSSKLVHGGLRYLRQGRFGLTRQAVQARQRLLHQGLGLIESLPFVFPAYEGVQPSRWAIGLGLAIFDLLGPMWSHRRMSPDDLKRLCPPLKSSGLVGGYRYLDARTDDARLVLRVLQEGARAGGRALNYAQVTGLLRSRSGQVCGVRLEDRAPGERRQAEVQARLVINAAGPWVDELRVKVGAPKRLRPLRGSHLIFPAARLPTHVAVSLIHPRDGRPVFVVPWENVVIFGTTDVDHGHDLGAEPRIHDDEVEYLLQALQHGLPSLELRTSDVQATFAGVRAVVGTGRADPSKESREHAMWLESGLLSVTGGKLTTFDRMAQETLRVAAKRLAGLGNIPAKGPALDPIQSELVADSSMDPQAKWRLLGRYGEQAGALLAAARAGDVDPIEATASLWAELRWAARAEAVIHLEDLLLRRVRLGLLLPEGATGLLPQVRDIIQEELRWSDERWKQEEQAYRDLWTRCYSPPA